MVFVGSPERPQMTNAEREERQRVLLNAPPRPHVRLRNGNTPNLEQPNTPNRGNHVQRRLDFETPDRIQREFKTPSKPARRGR